VEDLVYNWMRQEKSEMVLSSRFPSCVEQLMNDYGAVFI